MPIAQVYSLPISCIDDTDGIDTLVLKGIQLQEIAVELHDEEFVYVTYKEQTIVKMRGVEFIQTEDGCFSVEDLLVKV